MKFGLIVTDISHILAAVFFCFEATHWIYYQFDRAKKILQTFPESYGWISD